LIRACNQNFPSNWRIAAVSALPVLVLPSGSTESDVEQAFIYPLLTHTTYLGIPNDVIRTKSNLAIYNIDKGDHKRRYHPDYIVYADALPLVVIEAKTPLESATEGFREAQLYAHELNKQYPSGLNPARLIISTNSHQLVIGQWDDNNPRLYDVKTLTPGSENFRIIKSQLSWDFLQVESAKLLKKIYPANTFFPYEQLGENRVRIAKISNNSFAEELSPLLQRYFESSDPAYEKEIIEKAYVSTDETTRYERLFEDFLRDRVTPLNDRTAQILQPTKNKEDNLTKKILDIKKLKEVPGYLQLIIGAVGAGKSTFIKRYFEYLVPSDLKQKMVYIYFDFNQSPEDGSSLEKWVCQSFIEEINSRYRYLVDTSEPNQLRAVFNADIRDREGAYKLLRQANPSAYEERLANDLINWMSDHTVYAKALSRYLGGDKGLNLVFAFDNVDRFDRESQLKIFQTAQWFKNVTKSFCIVSLRDTTFETYKSLPPLDTFVKSSNFYIQPPRFVDMVRRRLDLAIGNMIEASSSIIEYEIEGLGKIKYPKTNIGEYLNGIYLDLFRRKRKITMILEGLAGRSARKALEMFAAILKSGHLDARQFTNSMLSRGETRLQEAHLIKSLMRTDYLYFYEGHGFVHNIYDYPINSKSKSHALKFEILEFLIENRKKLGDARAEGFFSVQFLNDRFSRMGFPPDDVITTLQMLAFHNLIISDHMRSTEIAKDDFVRVHASGFIHARILSARVDYIAACALVTPIANRTLAEKIGQSWHIRDIYTDIRHKNKNEIAALFIRYLEGEIDKSRPQDASERALHLGSSSLISRAREAIGFTTKSIAPQEVAEPIMETFDRLFTE
jgi:hypothetical protein